MLGSRYKSLYHGAYYNFIKALIIHKEKQIQIKYKQRNWCLMSVFIVAYRDTAKLYVQFLDQNNPKSKH